jgi:hypothetical protein
MGSENGNGSRDLARGTIPILISLALTAAVSGIAYTAGGVMEGINSNRSETNARLTKIEAAISEIRAALARRGCGG